MELSFLGSSGISSSVCGQASSGEYLISLPKTNKIEITNEDSKKLLRFGAGKKIYSRKAAQIPVNIEKLGLV